jgi:hypothetical protein
MSRSLTPQIDLEQELRRISPDLSERLEGVRKAVNKVWEVPYLHWYTDHGPQHSRRVIDLISQILYPLCHENHFPLSDYELYILLAACYLHDLGMQDLKVDERSVDELGPGDWEAIRKGHPKRSFEIIRDRTIKPRPRRTIDLGLAESDDDDSLMPIALVSMAHGSEYFESAVRMLRENLYNPAGKSIRGDLLAALLMMGDEIDLHKSRANLPGDSKTFSPLCLLHHYKHTYISSVAVQDGNSRLDRQVVIGFLFPPQAEGSYDQHIEAWVVSKIVEQANRTQDILLRATKGQLRWDEEPVVANIRYDRHSERETLPPKIWKVLKLQLKKTPKAKKLREPKPPRLRKKPRQQRVIKKIAWAILSVFVFTLIFVVFRNQIFAIVDHVGKEWLFKSVVAPRPTVAIPGIARIEVFMNGGQLNLDRLPSLTGGEAVVLEVIVFDTDGKRYTSDDLVCTWSVAPLGDEDEVINTDLCKTLYIPSQEYSSQTVVVEVEGLEQQFEPSDAISMKFDIVK